MLYIVGTPIGNLSDISLRAKEVLQAVDVVACEDTRRTGLLLAALDIHKRLISYHEHNRSSKGNLLLSLLTDGQSIALVSDAGMPCISDPGEDLVKLCIDNEIPVSVIPGPVAAISALVLSGLDTHHFIFEGFLPSEGKERRTRIASLKSHYYTFILYEAPHRLLRTLKDLADAGFSERRAAFCRELTKKFEEVIRLPISEAIEFFEEKPPRGEFVVVVEGKPEQNEPLIHELSEEVCTKTIQTMLANGVSTKEISNILAKEWGISKKSVYAMVIKMIN